MVATHQPSESHVYYDVVVAHTFTKGGPTGTAGELQATRTTVDSAIEPEVHNKLTKFKPLPGRAPPNPEVQFSPLALTPWDDGVKPQQRNAAHRRMCTPDVRQSIS